MRLDEIPNIGKQLASKLEKVGIHNSEDLVKIGSRKAFIKLRAEFDEGCLNMLYALEGAVQGIRWHSLSKNVKIELKRFYDTFETK